MAEKKITRKVITQVLKEAPEIAEQGDEQKVDPIESGRPKKACHFCQSKTQPVYTDMANLRRFVTERAKIVPKAKSNLCSKHQRSVTRNIKYARHLSLLPFTPKV